METSQVLQNKHLMTLFAVFQSTANSTWSSLLTVACRVTQFMPQVVKGLAIWFLKSAALFNNLHATHNGIDSASIE